MLRNYIFPVEGALEFEGVFEASYCRDCGQVIVFSGRHNEWLHLSPSKDGKIPSAGSLWVRCSRCCDFFAWPRDMKLECPRCGADLEIDHVARPVGAAQRLISLFFVPDY